MICGTIKFFDANKRFGFIVGDDGVDYFFNSYKSELGLPIYGGERVEFTSLIGSKGRRANGVTLLTPGYPSTLSSSARNPGFVRWWFIDQYRTVFDFSPKKQFDFGENVQLIFLKIIIAIFYIYLSPIFLVTVFVILLPALFFGYLPPASELWHFYKIAFSMPYLIFKAIFG